MSAHVRYGRAIGSWSQKCLAGRLSWKAWGAVAILEMRSFNLIRANAHSSQIQQKLNKWPVFQQNLNKWFWHHQNLNKWQLVFVTASDVQWGLHQTQIWNSVGMMLWHIRSSLGRGTKHNMALSSHHALAQQDSNRHHAKHNGAVLA